MRRYLLLLVAFLFSISLYAQTNLLEAKAAYLLAEESYGKGDMRTTLQYLDDAISKLGSSNAKILYLKIVSLKELSARDTAFASKLDLAVSEFEKTPDISSFNEEKALEVMKIKLERNKERNRGVTMKKGFDDLQKELNCYIGMGMDSVIDLHKEGFKDYFKENGAYFIMRNHQSGRKSITTKEKVTDSGYAVVTDANNLTKKFILWKRGALNGFSYFYYYYPFGKETADFSLSRREQAVILEKFNALFGYLPEPIQTGSSGVTITQYSWRLADRSVNLSIMHQSSASLGSTSHCSVTLL